MVYHRAQEIPQARRDATSHLVSLSRWRRLNRRLLALLLTVSAAAVAVAVITGWWPAWIVALLALLAARGAHVLVRGARKDLAAASQQYIQTTYDR